MRIALMAVAAFAACAPAAEPPAASGPAALDSASAVAAVDTYFAEYSRRLIAGDAPGVSALFTEDATITFFGAPTTTGRPGIEAFYAGSLQLTPRTATSVVVTSANGSVPGMLTALGTNSETSDSAGIAVTQHWRWAGVWRLGADGQWRTAYAIGFPDSVTRSK